MVTDLDADKSMSLPLSQNMCIHNYSYTCIELYVYISIFKLAMGSTKYHAAPWLPRGIVTRVYQIEMGHWQWQYNSPIKIVVREFLHIYHFQLMSAGETREVGERSNGG